MVLAAGPAFDWKLREKLVAITLGRVDQAVGALAELEAGEVELLDVVVVAAEKDEAVFDVKELMRFLENEIVGVVPATAAIAFASSVLLVSPHPLLNARLVNRGAHGPQY